MEKADRCISCGVGLIEEGFVSFPCPSCGAIIGRCRSCRKQGVTYTCPKCGFSGP